MLLPILGLAAAFHIVVGRNWSLSLLESDPRMPPNAPLDELVSRKNVEVLDWGCLFQTDRPGHSKNKWNNLEINRTEMVTQENFLPGTTVWVNEHMAVGHLMYDVQLIQLLQSTKVDRIILQRAPCANVDLCAGIGVFETFFRGFYAAALDAFQPGVPIFVRWVWQDKNAKPVYVTTEKLEGDKDVAPHELAKSIFLHPSMCMERCIRNLMRCRQCFYNSLSADAVQKFKTTAYKHVSLKDPTAPLPLYFKANKPIVVTLAHRGMEARRHIDNLPLLVKHLQDAFVSPTFDLRVVDTTNNMRLYFDQTRMVAESQVIIAEHGAFQSNMVYLRNGSLLVDLRGEYPNGEPRNFEALGQMFGVFIAAVKTSNLDSHWAEGFNVTEQDCASIISAVQEYVETKPYQFNVH